MSAVKWYMVKRQLSNLALRSIAPVSTTCERMQVACKIIEEWYTDTNLFVNSHKTLYEIPKHLGVVMEEKLT